MAQSNHHRPDSPAGELQPARRHCGDASRAHRAPSASPRGSFGATRLPVPATDEPRIVGARVCVGRARP